MALVWAVEPSPVIAPAGQARAGPDPEAATDPPVVAVVLEHAARERALRAATAAIFEMRVMLTIILQSAVVADPCPPDSEARDAK
jgi:hypothetical protein